MNGPPPGPASPAAGRRLVLFSKPGCHLCDDARAMLDRIGHPYEVAEDPRFALRVPVVEVDGRIVTEGRVSERAVRAALRRRRWGIRR